jgi:2-keto-4-pentenoate hydratase
VSDEGLDTPAAALRQAERQRRAIAPLTETDPGLTLEDAYQIQTINVEARLAEGGRIAGRKVGLTSKPMQEMLGVSEPDFGALLDDMFVEEGEDVMLDALLQPRIEAEIAFLMGRELTGPGVTSTDALVAVAGALPALEIIDSRVADWKIKLIDTVADNASCGRVVVGGRLTTLSDLDLRLVGMALTRGGETVDTGAGAAVLGNPIRCVAWLANRLAQFGASLKPGDIVLAGALHKAVAVGHGDVVRAEFAHLGSVTTRFMDADAGSSTGQKVSRATR